NYANGDNGCAVQEVDIRADLSAAFFQGLDIGIRAVVNAGATTLRSTFTLGIVDNPWEVMSVDQLSADDRALYNQSFGIASVGTELLASVVPVGLARNCGRMATVARGIAYAQTGRSLTEIGRGVAEGDPLKAAMGGLGLFGNMATLRQLNSLPCFTREMQV